MQVQFKVLGWTKTKPMCAFVRPLFTNPESDPEQEPYQILLAQALNESPWFSSHSISQRISAKKTHKRFSKMTKKQPWYKQGSRAQMNWDQEKRKKIKLDLVYFCALGIIFITVSRIRNVIRETEAEIFFVHKIKSSKT